MYRHFHVSHVRSILRSVAAISTGDFSQLRVTPQLGNKVRPLFQRRSYTTEIAGPGHGENKIQLRAYQEESIRRVLEYLEKGGTRPGLSLATGSGKTVIFSHLIDRVAPQTPDADQTLVIAHRKELVEQAARQCRELYPDKTIEVEMGTQHATGTAAITVASIQSIVSGSRLSKYDSKRFKLLVVDEAHHVAASTYLDVLGHFNLLQNQERGPTALVGVSATFARTDGLSLGVAIDDIVYHMDYLDMIGSDILAGLIFTTVHSGADVSHVTKTTMGDFQVGLLSKAVNNDEANATTVRAWRAKAGNRRSTLVFCVDTAHVRSLTDMFRQHGIDARYVTGSTSKKTRKERLDAFKAGEYPVLLNCSIFTEGTDIPNIDCVLLARPTKSRGLMVQMIGRGLRKHAGKGDCHVIDMVASLETGIVTTPTLFGLNPHELVDNMDEKAMKALRDRKASIEAREEQLSDINVANTGQTPEPKGNVTFTDYDNVHDLVEDTSGERHIRAISQFAWVDIGDNRYYLSSKYGDYLRIERTEKEYVVTLTPKLAKDATSKSPYARSRQVGKAHTFEAAVSAADTFAKNKFPYGYSERHASWRRFPATERQINFLNQSRDEDRKLKIGDLTKGKAAEWLTKMKFGAISRFNRMKMQHNRAQKVQEAKRRWERRTAPVKAGPVGVEPLTS